MDVLVTGTASGIGRACAELFLERGHNVVGLDVAEASIEHECYRHLIADVRDRTDHAFNVNLFVHAEEAGERLSILIIELPR